MRIIIRLFGTVWCYVKSCPKNASRKSLLSTMSLQKIDNCAYEDKHLVALRYLARDNNDAGRMHAHVNVRASSASPRAQAEREKKKVLAIHAKARLAH